VKISLYCKRFRIKFVNVDNFYTQKGISFAQQGKVATKNIFFKLPLKIGAPAITTGLYRKMNPDDVRLLLN
jgi:ATP phosphoribosyltransferase regulatory subunit HisZ